MSKKTTSHSRRQRREMYRRAGFLRIKNTYNPLGSIMANWYAKTREEGKNLHESHTRMVQEQIEEKLQSVLNKSKETWTGLGYNDAEIKMLEEAFSLRNVKDRETFTADRKQAKRLEREAYKLKLARA
jgi:hypothetical protein